MVTAPAPVDSAVRVPKLSALRIENDPHEENCIVLQRGWRLTLLSSHRVHSNKTVVFPANIRAAGGHIVTVERTNGHRSYFALPLLAIAIVAVAGAWLRPGAPPAPGAALNAGDTAWMLAASALVLFMTPGLSFFYGGMVRTRNVVSTMLQSFVAMGVIGVLWVVIGFSLAFGDSLGGLIGDPRTFLMFRHVGAETNATLAATVPLVIF